MEAWISLLYLLGLGEMNGNYRQLQAERDGTWEEGVDVEVESFWIEGRRAPIGQNSPTPRAAQKRIKLQPLLPTDYRQLLPQKE